MFLKRRTGSSTTNTQQKTATTTINNTPSPALLLVKEDEEGESSDADSEEDFQHKTTSLDRSYYYYTKKKKNHVPTTGGRSVPESLRLYLLTGRCRNSDNTNPCCNNKMYRDRHRRSPPSGSLWIALTRRKDPLFCRLRCGGGDSFPIAGISALLVPPESIHRQPTNHTIIRFQAPNNTTSTSTHHHRGGTTTKKTGHDRILLSRRRFFEFYGDRSTNHSTS